MVYRTNKMQYNTKTGIKLIARDMLRHPYKDSETYFEADLYKTKDGAAYFLCGKGGELSLFGGRKEEKIIPLSKEKAKSIAKEFMKPQAYQEEFRR
jgi:hypothetical protein